MTTLVVMDIKCAYFLNLISVIAICLMSGVKCLQDCQPFVVYPNTSVAEGMLPFSSAILDIRACQTACITDLECHGVVFAPSTEWEENACFKIIVDTNATYYYAGSTYLKLNRECGDVDECALNISGCQHVCVNSPGSFYCLCYGDYTLDSNGRTCSACASWATYNDTSCPDTESFGRPLYPLEVCQRACLEDPGCHGVVYDTVSGDCLEVTNPACVTTSQPSTVYSVISRQCTSSSVSTSTTTTTSTSTTTPTPTTTTTTSPTSTTTTTPTTSTISQPTTTTTSTSTSTATTATEPTTTTTPPPPTTTTTPTSTTPSLATILYSTSMPSTTKTTVEPVPLPTVTSTSQVPFIEPQSTAATTSQSASTAIPSTVEFLTGIETQPQLSELQLTTASTETSNRPSLSTICDLWTSFNDTMPDDFVPFSRSLNVTTLEQCQAACIQDSTCRGVAYTSLDVVWKMTCVKVSSETVSTSALNGVAFYKLSRDCIVLSPDAVQKNITATCIINETSGVYPIYGIIRLSQSNIGGPTRLDVTLSGFNSSASGYHGFHVHVYGNLSNSCLAAGGHYNPDSVSHGAPYDPVRHVGDLGNVFADTNGEVNTVIVDNVVSLIGNRSVIGRSIVVHSSEDDYGRGGFTDSNTTGHAGVRYGCCLIVVDSADRLRSLHLFTVILFIWMINSNHINISC